MQTSFRTKEFKGLSSTEAASKLENEGYNELPSSKPKNIFQIAIGVVKEPMFLLLVACGTLYLILGDIQEGLMLLSFVFVVMGIICMVQIINQSRLILGFELTGIQAKLFGHQGGIAEDLLFRQME